MTPLHYFASCLICTPIHFCKVFRSAGDCQVQLQLPRQTCGAEQVGIAAQLARLYASLIAGVQRSTCADFEIRHPIPSFLFGRPQVARVPWQLRAPVNLNVGVSVGHVKVSMSLRKASVLAGMLWLQCRCWSRCDSHRDTCLNSTRITLHCPASHSCTVCCYINIICL